MASIDITTRALWGTKEPALGLLAAASCARAACVGLSPEEAAPFEALAAALLSWWPARKRSPDELYKTEFTACLVARESGPERLRLPMEAAYLEMAALLRLDPRSLPADGFYDLGEDDFVALVRKVAKAERTDLELWKARFEAMLEAKSSPWPELVARAGRMGFGRDLSKLRELPEPLEGVARFAALGAVWSWSMMGPKHALRLELGSTKRIAVLDDAQRATLLSVLPWLAPG